MFRTESMTNRSTKSLPHEGRSWSPATSRLLLWAVDAGLAATILFVPLAMGGRTAVGQLLLVVLATGVAACWCLRQGLSSERIWVRSPAGWLVLGVLGFLGLQIAPLPASAGLRGSRRACTDSAPWAPRSPEGAATIGLWKTLSLAPVASRDGFVVVLAFALLFLTVAQRVRRPDDVERFLKWISLATLIMAVFALVQFFFGNGKFFWFYEYPYATTSDAVKGSFSNRNHFAAFHGIGHRPLDVVDLHHLAAHAGGRRRPVFQQGAPARPGARSGLLAVGLALIVFAGILSLSRGGAAAMFVAALTCLLIVHRVHRLNRKILLALVGAAGLTGVSARLRLSIRGGSAARLLLGRSVGPRKRTTQDMGGRSESHGRLPGGGAGLGSHVEVYPRYLPEDEGTQFVEYTHAENGYVQIGLETGIPGLLLLAVALGLCVLVVRAGLLRQAGAERISLCFVGVAPGLLASAVHSAVDFVWYVPGCMVTPVILAACGCRLRQMADPCAGRSGGKTGLVCRGAPAGLPSPPAFSPSG